MSTFATSAHPGRPDGVRPRLVSPPKARGKEPRTRSARPARHWPSSTDGARYGVLDPNAWPSWTSEVRIALGRKGVPMIAASQTDRAELAPATLDYVILSGLISARRPVAAGDLPRACGLDPYRGVAERQQSLDRLEARGLITSRVVRSLDPRRPLLDWIQTTVYQAIGGGQ